MNPPHAQHTHRRHSWRLLALTAVVLLVHWAALQAAPRALGAHDSSEPTPATRAFSMRTIAESAALQPPVVQEPKQQTPTPSSPRKPITTAPSARETAATAPTAPTAQSVELNRAPALDQYAIDAIETVANSIPPLATEPPILLAAADAPVETPAAVAPVRPVAAKAVRNYVFPPPIRLKYDVKGEVKGFPYFVNGELQWAQDGKTYDARMEISHFLLGSRVQTSTGQLTAQGLEPLRFGDKVRSEVAAHFDYSKNKVTFSANTPDAALLPGAQDQLSVLAQLAAMLGGDAKGFPKGSTLTFQAVGPRSSESWTLTVGVTEKLSLPGGEMSALRLWRDPSGEYDTKLEVWMAPALGFLPARVRLTQANGDYVDQQWRTTVGR